MAGARRMLNLHHVRSFIAVVEEGGLRAAARRLSLSPTAVLDHLNRLERDLGATLLQRRGAAAGPTAQGARFVPLARAMLATAREARALLATDIVRIAASSNIGGYLLPPLLADLRRAGAAEPALWIGDNLAVADRLRRGQADIALMEWWSEHAGFDSRAWRRAPLVAIAPPGHAWGALEAVDCAALSAEPILAGEPGTGTGAALREIFGDGAARLRVVEGFGATEAVKRGVRAGLGVSVVAAFSVADEAASGSLLVRPLAPQARKTLHLAMPSNRREGGAVDRCAAFLLVRGSGVGADGSAGR
jgi:DNA-binding transcriptional LysR family regulator